MKSKKGFALITGGSSGIGWAMAHELAKRSYHLLLVSNQQESLAACKQEIEETYGVLCETLFADLAEPAAAQKVYDHCTTQQIAVEVLVNNAGMLVFSEVAEAPQEKVSAILQLHINTPTMLCRLFGAQMKTNRHGYILNVSSISAVMAYPGISLYGPSKTYMRAFTRALRTEMSVYQVAVTCVLPGATATALYDPQRVNISLAKKTGVMHDASFVARQSMAALFNNRAECIPGIMNKITVCLLPFVPYAVIRLIYRNTNLIQRGRQSLG